MTFYADNTVCSGSGTDFDLGLAVNGACLTSVLPIVQNGNDYLAYWSLPDKYSIQIQDGICNSEASAKECKDYSCSWTTVGTYNTYGYGVCRTYNTNSSFKVTHHVSTEFILLVTLLPLGLIFLAYWRRRWQRTGRFLSVFDCKKDYLDEDDNKEPELPPERSLTGRPNSRNTMNTSTSTTTTTIVINNNPIRPGYSYGK